MRPPSRICFTPSRASHHPHSEAMGLRAGSRQSLPARTMHCGNILSSRTDRLRHSKTILRAGEMVQARTGLYHTDCFPSTARPVQKCLFSCHCHHAAQRVHPPLGADRPHSTWSLPDSTAFSRSRDYSLSLLRPHPRPLAPLCRGQRPAGLLSCRLFRSAARRRCQSRVLPLGLSRLQPLRMPIRVGRLAKTVSRGL